MSRSLTNLTQDELDMILAEENVELIDSETDDIGLYPARSASPGTQARSSSSLLRRKNF